MTSLLQVDSSEFQIEVLKACLKGLTGLQESSAHPQPSCRMWRDFSTFICLTWAWKHQPILGSWLVLERVGVALHCFQSRGHLAGVCPASPLSTCFPSCLTAPCSISSAPNAGTRGQDFFPHSPIPPFFLTPSLVFHLYLQLAVKHFDLKCKTYKHAMCHVNPRLLPRRQYTPFGLYRGFLSWSGNMASRASVLFCPFAQWRPRHHTKAARLSYFCLALLAVHTGGSETERSWHSCLWESGRPRDPFMWPCGLQSRMKVERSLRIWETPRKRWDCRCL